MTVAGDEDVFCRGIYLYAFFVWHKQKLSYCCRTHTTNDVKTMLLLRNPKFRRCFSDEAYADSRLMRGAAHRTTAWNAKLRRRIALNNPIFVKFHNLERLAFSTKHLGLQYAMMLIKADYSWTGYFANLQLSSIHDAEPFFFNIRTATFQVTLASRIHCFPVGATSDSMAKTRTTSFQAGKSEKCLVVLASTRVIDEIWSVKWRKKNSVKSVLQGTLLLRLDCIEPKYCIGRYNLSKNYV